MGDGEKPYRLYKGGRVKGRVPLQRHAPPPTRGKAAPGAPPKQPRKPVRWGRRIALAAVLLLVLVVVWAVASYFAFSRGIDKANARLPATTKRELSAQDGLLTSTPTLILVLGTDGSKTGGRENARRSDSIMVLRTDPRTWQPVAD